jgi:hemerythrin-like metal-binding protein
MPLHWNDTLGTGHRQIDRQHQELIDLINEFEQMVHTGHEQDAWALALPRLQTYVLFHFATEEALFGQTDAAHAARHQAQHRAFVDRLAQWRAAPAVDPRGLLDYLKTWLVEHIMKTDRELARQLPGPV